MNERSSTIHFDARLSPAQAVSPELLRVAARRRPWPGAREEGSTPLLYDETLRWLTSSDRMVSDQAAQALVEVKEGKLHVKEGHARWSTYLRAFVPLSVRWCQQEMRRARALRDYPALGAAWAAGVLSKSHLRIVLRAVTPETEETWLGRAKGATVRELEEMATRERGAAAGLAASRDSAWGAGATVMDDDRGAGATASDGALGAVVRKNDDGGGTDGGCSEYAAHQANSMLTPPGGQLEACVATASAWDDPEDPRPTRRIVMAPPGVAVLVSEAVEVARKMAGYQVGIGAAVEMMAMETMAGLNEYQPSADSPGKEPTSEPDRDDGEAGFEPAQQASPEDMGRATDEDARRARRSVSLGDHADLRRELGIGWERIHQHMEAATGRWSDLPSDLREVLLHGAPAEGAGAHERVVFWTGLQGRLDAVRGRLLRIVEEGYLPQSLGFAGFGQYVRERLGLSLREAHELVRLDRALERLPVAFRMYASGRLGRRTAWLVSRVATSKTDRAWTRFALTHTLRLLEVVVEGALLKREADPRGWERDGGLPPQGATFAEALRACAHFKHVGPGGEATAKVEFLLDAEQLACYEATLGRLRETAHAHFAGHRLDAVGGLDAPEWWGLAVMAQHFLNCYGDEDRLASPARLRRMFHRLVIDRDNYTCRAPECLQRGGLEADHMQLRSVGGQTTHENMVALCAADHRFMKHTARTLALSGEAPDWITVRMGSRVYFNEQLVEPALSEVDLDRDPWTSERDTALAWKPGSVSPEHLAVS